MLNNDENDTLVLRTAQAGNWHEWVLFGSISLLFGILFLVNRDTPNDQMIGWILVVGGGLGIWSGFQRQKEGWIIVFWYKYGEITWMIFSDDAVLDESYSNPHLWTSFRISSYPKGGYISETFIMSRFEIIIKTADEPDWTPLFPGLPERVVFYQKDVQRFVDWMTERVPDLEVESEPGRKVMKDDQ